MLLEICSKAFWHIVPHCRQFYTAVLSEYGSLIIHPTVTHWAWLLNCLNAAIFIWSVVECLLILISMRHSRKLCPCHSVINIRNYRCKCVFHHSDNSSSAKIMKSPVQLAFLSHVMFLPSASVFGNRQQKDKQEEKSLQHCAKGLESLFPLGFWFFLGQVTVIMIYFPSWIIPHACFYWDGKRQTAILAVLHLNISIIWCNRYNVVVWTIHYFVYWLHGFYPLIFHFVMHSS